VAWIKELAVNQDWLDANFFIQLKTNTGVGESSLLLQNVMPAACGLCACRLGDGRAETGNGCLVFKRGACAIKPTALCFKSA
jgi:hypothetical protein